MAWLELGLEGQALSPLPPDLRQGLMAVSSLALVSFVASTALFLYLTYKFVAWRLRARRGQLQQGEPPRPRPHEITHFTLGIEGIFTEGDSSQAEAVASQDKRQDERNCWVRRQFLVLVYNLLLADIHQSLAFLLNASWLWRDGIMASTPTCFAQGLLISTGDLSSSTFITTIAIHEYLSVVRRRNPSLRTVRAMVVCNWVFVYAVSLLPVLVTRNGAERGGFFVRTGAWCWINKDYAKLHLVTHYLFVFLALCATSALCTATFLSTRRRPGQPPAHEPALLLYPLIYVLCTLPLALGRVATMTGRNVPMGYFCFAGSVIAFNGALDCLLFGTMRSAIISGPVSSTSAENFKAFAFLKTPSARRYGNMIWIQGGGDAGRRRDGRMACEWWPWHRPRLWSRPSSPWPREERPQSTSRESLRGAAIQMDMVTSVVIEVGPKDSWSELRRPERMATSASVSVTSADRIKLNG